MYEFKIADPFLRRMVYALGIMGSIALGFYTFSLLQGPLSVLLDILTPFLLGTVFAYILAPVVVQLQQRLRLGRIMGTLVIYLIVFLAIFVLLAVMIPVVLSQLIEMFTTLQEAIPVFLDWLSDNPYLSIDRELVATIRDKILETEMDYRKLAELVLPALQRMATGSVSTVEEVTRGIFSGFGSVAGFFALLAFAGIINFYLLLDWRKIGPVIRMMIPPRHREQALEILDRMDHAVGGFLRGQLTVAFLLGALFATGLFVIGFWGFPALSRYCILIGAVTAVGGLIPYLGPVMGITPAILIVLFSDGTAWGPRIVALLVVLGLFSVLQAVEGFVLQPKIVGKGAGLHPLAVMFALLVGAQFGIGGMILSVPAASACQVLIREFYWLPLQERESEAKRFRPTRANGPKPDGREGI